MKKLFLGIVLSTVLLMTACGNVDSKNMKADEAEQENTEVKANTEELVAEDSTQVEAEVEYADGVKLLENNVYEIKMAKVEITGSEVLPPNEYSDNNKLVLHFDVTSKVDPDEIDTEVSIINIWMATMNATQETKTSIVDLEVGSSPMDEQYTDTVNNQMDIIKKDATVSGIAYYELENRDSPVTIELTQGLMGDSLGSIEIDVSK